MRLGRCHLQDHFILILLLCELLPRLVILLYICTQECRSLATPSRHKPIDRPQHPILGTPLHSPRHVFVEFRRARIGIMYYKQFRSHKDILDILGESYGVMSPLWICFKDSSSVLKFLSNAAAFSASMLCCPGTVEEVVNLFTALSCNRQY